MEASLNVDSPQVLATLAQHYADLRAAREALDAQAKEARALEDEAKARLILAMDSQQIPSAKFKGIGRIVLKQQRRYEIQDFELFTRAVLQRIVDNAQAGRKLSDGFMLQKRPAKTIIDELAENENWSADAYATRGLAIAENLDLTFTREKG